MIGARRLLALLGVWCAIVAPVHAASKAAGPKGVPAKEASKAGCGNGRLDPGETCDDGNTKDGDYCPANCRIEPCKASGTRVDVSVDLTYPTATEVGGVVVFLDYPDGTVSLPGSGHEAMVAARISNVPKDFASSTYDLDYALREVVALSRPLPPGELFRVRFDLCEGAAPPAATGFKCQVEQASGPGGKTLPVAGFACSVAVP